MVANLPPLPGQRGLEGAGEFPPDVEDEDAGAVGILGHGQMAVELSVAHNGMIRLSVA